MVADIHVAESRWGKDFPTHCRLYKLQHLAVAPIKKAKPPISRQPGLFLKTRDFSTHFAMGLAFLG